MYPLGLQDFLNAAAGNMGSDDIRAMLVDSTYTYSATHHHVSDVTGTAIIQRAGAGVSTKTETNGTFDAADYTFGSNADTPPTGKTIAAVIIYDNTPATDATKTLLAFIDHDSGGAAISQATNGGNITAQWNASGIFSI